MKPDEKDLPVNITVRPATPEDAEAIVRLEMELADYLLRLGDSNPTSLTVESYLRMISGPSLLSTAR